MKKLYKDSVDQKIAGVCGGIAKYLGIDSTVIRLLWVLAVFFAGSGILAYIICALIIPAEPTDYYYRNQQQNYDPNYNQNNQNYYDPNRDYTQPNSDRN